MRAAAASSSVNNKIEVSREAEGRRHLQGRASLRNISGRAFELGRLITKDDKSVFQYPSTLGNPFFDKHGIET